MSISKLRNKEEAAMAAAKVQKKEDAKKPLSMHDALRERLLRRNRYAQVFKRCAELTLTFISNV